jgi:hypothetical protein
MSADWLVLMFVSRGLDCQRYINITSSCYEVVNLCVRMWEVPTCI